MNSSNIIRTFHTMGNGWDFQLTIRAADDQAYNEAKTYIRDTLRSGSDRARQEFLALLRERTGGDV